jgi:hypothetical protein
VGNYCCLLPSNERDEARNCASWMKQLFVNIVKTTWGYRMSPSLLCTTVIDKVDKQEANEPRLWIISMNVVLYLSPSLLNDASWRKLSGRCCSCAHQSDRSIAMREHAEPGSYPMLEGKSMSPANSWMNQQHVYRPPSHTAHGATSVDFLKCSVQLMAYKSSETHHVLPRCLRTLKS